MAGFVTDIEKATIGNEFFRKVLFPGDDPLAEVVFVHTPSLIETKLLHDPSVKTKVPDEETDPLEDDDSPDRP